MEGVLIELIFTAGPLLTAALAILIDPAAALVVGPASLLVGLALFLAQPPLRTWTVSEHAHAHGALGALRSPGIRTVMLTVAPMGFCFGAFEVAMPAFAEAHGHRPSAGILLALWSIGSAVGGIGYGARAWRTERARLYAWLAALLPVGYIPPLLAPSLVAMGPLALLAGLCIAPTLTAGNQVAGDVALAGAEAESFTWLSMALIVGLAAGNAVGGLLADGQGWRSAVLAAAAGAVLSAVLAAWRWRTLRPVTAGALG
jgi:MFS family permease